MALRALRWFVVALSGLLAMTGCAGQGSVQASPPAPGIIVEGAWVRTTEGAKDQTMTGAFMSLTNPGETDITLVSATCDLAGMTQIHEMVKQGDTMVMQEAKGGAIIPAGSHLHLKPGGYHVMLMKLKQPLPIGDQVAITLTFSDGTSKQVTAPVKQFTEEEDHYHSPTPTPTDG